MYQGNIAKIRNEVKSLIVSWALSGLGYKEIAKLLEKKLHICYSARNVKYYINKYMPKQVAK